MKIKIKNPIFGVPITIIDKVADDGFIHFSRNEEKMKFKILDINPHFFITVAAGLPKPKQLKITGRTDPYARILIKKYE